MFPIYQKERCIKQKQQLIYSLHQILSDKRIRQNAHVLLWLRHTARYLSQERKI